MVMKEENYKNDYEHKIQACNKFIAILGFLISISYLLRLAESGIDISFNDKLRPSVVNVFKRHFEQAFYLLNEFNLNDKELEDLFNKFKFIMEISQIREKLNSLNYFYDNSGDNFLTNIWDKLDLDDINLILKHIKKNEDLIISIKNLFLDRLIP